MTRGGQSHLIPLSISCCQMTYLWSRNKLTQCTPKKPWIQQECHGKVGSKSILTDTGNLCFTYLLLIKPTFYHIPAHQTLKYRGSLLTLKVVFLLESSFAFAAVQNYFNLIWHQDFLHLLTLIYIILVFWKKWNNIDNQTSLKSYNFFHRTHTCYPYSKFSFCLLL